MKKGFTLIELLIVITIIGILAVVFVPTILNAPSKARDVQRKADILSIVKVLQAGRLDGVSLPSSIYMCADETTLSNFLKYLPNGKVPRDPSNLTVGYCTGKYQIVNAVPLMTWPIWSPNITGVLSTVVASVENPSISGNSIYCNTGSFHVAYNLLYSLVSSGSTTLCYVAKQTK